MIKFIYYHLLYLFNKKWLFLLGIVVLSCSLLFSYLSGGFETEVERLLQTSNNLIEYEEEAFLIINLLLSVWIIGASKEIFSFEEPHVVLINKTKYLKTKIIAYWLYYLFVGILIYGIYQIILVSFYSLRPFNYLFIFNLLINISITHLAVILLSGNNKNILLSMVFIIVFLLLNGLNTTEFWFNEIIFFFFPLQNLKHSSFGYLHCLVFIITTYYLAFYKHFSFST
ncbi:MAG: hypothetical protein GX149_05475 [Acholeplasmataceae bacterium]|nr:hypothetical protein [Acholeplasmataceae bacterium]